MFQQCKRHLDHTNHATIPQAQNDQINGCLQGAFNQINKSAIGAAKLMYALEQSDLAGTKAKMRDFITDEIKGIQQIMTTVKDSLTDAMVKLVGCASLDEKVARLSAASAVLDDWKDAKKQAEGIIGKQKDGTEAGSQKE